MFKARRPRPQTLSVHLPLNDTDVNANLLAQIGPLRKQLRSRINARLRKPPGGRW